MDELPPMPEEDVMASALSDPDKPLLNEADLARLKPLPKARSLRIRLRLTQEDLAARTRIPPAAPRGWEQRRCVLRDGPKRGLLRMRDFGGLRRNTRSFGDTILAPANPPVQHRRPSS
jgi:DNA-binding transcriptional regulator YiaG